MQKGELQPLYHLNALSKRYPHAWKMVEAFRALRGKELPSWPDWCFLPLSAWNKIDKTCPGANLKSPKLGSNLSELAAMGTWRYTQGIYQFDQDLLTALINTELTGEIPCEALLRLPEWSVYIETPGVCIGGLPLQGVWAYLDWSMADGNTTIHLLLNMEFMRMAIYLIVAPMSLQEAVSNMMNDISQQAKQEGMKAPVQIESIASDLAKNLNPLLSLVLYLCSEEPDISSPRGSKPHRTEAKKTRKGIRLFAPDKPTIWRVGETIGRVLRQGRAEVSSTANSPRTHIRRAHWHGYWLGNGDQKRFKYNWLSPIVVRGREVIEQDPLPSTRSMRARIH